MKHIQTLNENFKLVDLGNKRWFGEQPSDEYKDQVRSLCLSIMMEETATSEKAFSKVDGLVDVYKWCARERGQEMDAIIHNCYTRNMRAAFCAETVYDAVVKGRVEALKLRPEF